MPFKTKVRRNSHTKKKHKELANVDLGLGLESWLGLGIGSGVVEGLWGTPFPQIFLEEMPFPK